MWLSFSRVSDPAPKEESLRSAASVACGLLLRDMSGWLFNASFSRETWRQVPGWAPRLLVDISTMLEVLDQRPKDHDIASIEKTYARFCNMIDTLQSPPLTSGLRGAMKAYLKHRRDHADQKEVD
jgi:hypothetical protein